MSRFTFFLAGSRAPACEPPRASRGEAMSGRIRGVLLGQALHVTAPIGAAVLALPGFGEPEPGNVLRRGVPWAGSARPLLCRRS